MRTKQLYKSKQPVLNKYARRANMVANKVTAKSAALSALRAAGLQGYARVGGAYGRYGYSAKRAGYQPELKSHSSNISGAFDATGEVIKNSVVLIAQGDSSVERDGRKATIKSMTVRGTFHYVPAATSGTAAAYLYIVLDTQANGAAPAFTDVFDSTSADRCMLNLDNSARFKILKKVCVPFVAPSGVAAAKVNMIVPVEFHLKLNIPIEWSSTTGAITELKSNNILALGGCDTASDGDDLIACNLSCRVRFIG